ncbi:MAG: 3-phosphoshikimate 1-carboxyvinyltransferase, partial [Oscillospiraceae bacterium]
MDISVHGKLCGVVAAPPSKSQSHRLLIASFLCRQPVIVANITYSQDILATIDCCKSLGGDIECKETSVVFNGFNQSVHADLNCRESGSTLRFMLPIAAALGITSSFSGEGRLPQRPIDEMLTVLTSKGVTGTATTLPLTLSGMMRGGDYYIDPSQSSQYLTGLLYALPLLCEDSKIYLTAEIQSKPYIDMTLQVLEQFGIKITETSYGYLIKGKQKYAPIYTTVEGDWSNAAFWLCAGAIGDKLCCKGLNINSTQGDKAIVNLLQQFGCNISAVNGAVTVSGENLNGISIDATHIPDAIPVLAVVAACSLGKTTIYN